jgi:DNA repair protein RecN (Recombination protein N)
MIQRLHIENYALIEHLDIRLHEGFSVITGETGAGKSIILGAIGLLLGQRADTKSIKQGAARCVVEAWFDLSRYHFHDFFESNNLDFDGRECIVRREITSAGKSRAFINDTPVQLAQLRELGEQLIDVHSQHKNLLLSQANFQQSVLDILAENSQLLHDYKAEYQQWGDLVRQYHEQQELLRQSKEGEDFMRFQLSQLAEASLQAGEQAELEAEQETLEHAEEIKQSLYEAASALQSGSDGVDALQLVRHSKQSLDTVLRVFAQGEQLASRLEACYIELKDIADELESRSESVEYDPERLSFVGERLSTLYTLEKKHRLDSVEALIALQHELEEKLSLTDNSEAVLEALRSQCQAQQDKALGLARKLSQRRRQAAQSLEARMVAALQPLGMPNVQFRVEMSQGEELSPTGIDTVTFLFTANKSTPLQPIARVASGGEIARVMLALKSLIAGAVKLPTIIFDEIDTGVSGSIAEKMARIMREMGDHDRQVISITHLPQIASLGAHHYKVYKEDLADTTLSHIVELTDDERVVEIAHMLSGEAITDAALQNARSLLNLQAPPEM